ncbi:MAG: response regulator transcription factor [Anaerolineae bacterium]|nr:response regulator transcription factor [Anaerolineae bacterium]NUQ03441.1 response regulator transcription factor [Anaerolineae bacterium]
MTDSMNDAAPENALVLVVDDEKAIRYSVSRTLQKAGYEVIEASSGEEALTLLAEHPADVVLTDIRMPEGLDGVELLRRIKAVDTDIVVILMTAYPHLSSAVEALRLGAHDYLIKPSSGQDIRMSVARGVERARNLRRRRELLDVIRNNLAELSKSEDDKMNGGIVVSSEALSRSRDLAVDLSPEGVMTLGPLTIFLGRYKISIDGQSIELTPTEFDLLLYLAAHCGRVVSCHELVREVRGYGVDEAEAREVIRPHVSNLRRKLKECGDYEDLIINVRGIGYRLNISAE